MKILLYALFLLPLFIRAEQITYSGGTVNSSNYPTLDPGDTLNVTSNNSGIDFNIQGTAGHTILVRAVGTITISGTFYFGYGGGARWVTIKGFWFSGTLGEAIKVEGNSATIHTFTIDGNHFLNSGFSDKLMDFRDDIDFNSGSQSTTVNDSLRIINNTFRNVGQIAMKGNFDTAGINKGLYTNFEFANNTVDDCSGVGSLIYVENMGKLNGGCKIHHNVLDSINLSLSNHPGIFLINGLCDVYNNKVTNHYGNLCRMFAFTIGSTKGTAYIYNNIVWNSKKYSAFEFQTFGWQAAQENGGFGNKIDKNHTIASSIDMFVYNNTYGKLNTNNDWQAACIDEYDLDNGTLTVKNNLGFNTNATGDHIINGAGGTNDPGQTVTSNNLYYSTYILANLTDEVSFIPESDATNLLGQGTNIGTPVTLDYYATSRPNPPAIGAVELQGSLSPLSEPVASTGTVTNASIEVLWTSVTNATNYIVEQSTASDFTGSVQIYSGNNLSYTAVGLNGNTHYYFRVKAQGPGYEDSDWDEADTTTLTGPVINQVKFFITKPYKP